MYRYIVYFIITCNVFAQTTGKISGVVKDKSAASPLPGANVYLENTSFGSASDDQGMFTLINIPPGKYNLKIDMTELKKIMGGLAEKAKVSIRNIRREANDKLKKDLKDKKIGEDECKNSEKKIQNLTDQQIKDLEKKLEEKEKEIMTV